MHWICYDGYSICSACNYMVEAKYNEENVSSARLLYKLGFKKEAALRTNYFLKMCQKQILTQENKLIIIVSKIKVAREAYGNYIIEKCIAEK